MRSAAYRERQKAELADDPLHRHVKGEIHITDDQIRESLEGAQLRAPARARHGP